MNKEIKVSRAWLEGLLKNKDRVETDFDEKNNFKLQSSVAVLIGYIDSAKSYLENKNND